MIISTKFEGNRQSTTIRARMIYYDVVPAQIIVIADKRDRDNVIVEFWTTSSEVLEPPSVYVMPNVGVVHLIEKSTSINPVMSQRGDAFVFSEPDLQREVLVSRSDLKNALLIAANFLRSASK